VRTSGRRPRRPILSIGIGLILAGVVSAGCPHRAVRVPVTEENVLRANEASQDGDIAFSRKNYYAALIKYLEAVRLNPNNENMLNRLGIIYSQLKYYGEASGAFQGALRLNPRFSYAVNNLGSVFFAQRNLKKAEIYFKKAIGLKGNEASFHMNLGSVYFEKKKYEKAMAEWHKGLALDPEILSKGSSVSLTGSANSSPMERSYFMARLYASSGKVESAIENLKLAITEGFSDVAAIEKQHDFDPIRQDARFAEFMKNISLLIRLQSRIGLPEGSSGTSPSK
jgi:tetratricopeptide (TPR) repeat protein